MGCAVGTAKYLLFFFNFVFFITGVAIIAVGGVVLYELGRYEKAADISINSAPTLLIVVGVFVTLISFFGCCGAIKHNYCMLITFAVLLSLIFILELAAGITAYVNKDKIENELEKAMNSSIRNKDNWAAWNELQEDMHCCGWKSEADWSFNSTIPNSCCEKQKCEPDNEKPTNFFKDGCMGKLKKSIEDNIYKIGGVGIGIAFIQIIGIVFACCLASAVKHSA